VSKAARLRKCRCGDGCPLSAACEDEATQEDLLCDYCRAARDGTGAEEGPLHCHECRNDGEEAEEMSPDELSAFTRILRRALRGPSR
jgi:hypothetical protein